ncbi:MAG: hypothetical protein KKC75_02985 [Nanoarchaeota archaeon]|nr:hypothetical protein [Nanoarchaeota archaeon]MBU1004553.1 hypothetical protein [Nanoarchaeota archaeon]MBU1945792.1 hypothetical protein [Nanoarchaeota archaeon]
MGSFDRRGSGKFRGRSSGGYNRRDSGRTSRGVGRPLRDSKKEMHEVTCDKCGKSCEVPFKPTGSKPVYCRDCYRKDEDSGSESRFGSRRESRPRYGNSEPRQESNSSAELEQINAKLDRILELLGNE